VARELSVLVACADDGDALRALVDRTQRTLARCGIDGELVLVADGPLAAGVVVDDLAAAHANVVALHHDRGRGRVACWSSALAQAAGAVVCTLEPGAGHRPEAIARLYLELTAMRAEVAQGTRAPLASLRPALRWYLGHALDRVVGGVLGVRGSDVRSSFVLTTRDVLGDVLAHADRFARAPGLLVAVAAQLGYGVRQVETAYDGALDGAERDAVGELLRATLALRIAPPRERIEADGSAPSAAERLPGPRRAAAAHSGELMRTQWLDADALRALQRRRLEAMLRHAARHVEYYRARLERLGLGDDDAPRLVDLGELPLLERATLCEDHALTLVSPSRDPARLRRVVTVTAGGELLEVFVDAAAMAVHDALEARHREWAGLEAGALRVRLSFGAVARGPLAGARLRLEAARAHRVTLPIGLGDAADVDVALARLATLETAVLEGSAEALVLLASRAAGLRLGAVVSHGQSLDARLRARLEQAFGAPLFDRYGTRELGTVAQECEAHAGLHVNAETHVVEVLCDGRTAGDGEEGEIVVTDLGNRVVPLLRYRIGDRAALVRERCPCGRAAPRLTGVRGREPTFVRAAGGRMVPSAVLDHLFRARAAVVRRFQVEQHADGRVIVRVVRRPGFSTVHEAALRGALRALLGEPTPTDVVFVEWLAPGARAHVPPGGDGACRQLPLAL
jgi:phenylacetate-CoA ligase